MTESPALVKVKANRKKVEKLSVKNKIACEKIREHNKNLIDIESTRELIQEVL